MKSKSDLKEFEDILKKIDKHPNPWQRAVSALFCVVIVIMIGVAGGVTVCKCHWIYKNDICAEEKSSNPNSVDLKFRSESIKEKKDFKYDLSLKGTSSNINNDCFWFIIFFSLIISLIILFYFILHSSKEKRFIQLFLDIKELKIKGKKEMLQILSETNNLNMKEREQIFQSLSDSKEENGG